MPLDENKLSLKHLVRQPLSSSPETGAPLLVLLHGVGSNEQDLFQLAPALYPRFIVLSARGPEVLAPGRFGWFQVEFRPEGNRANLEQAETSRQRLIKFLSEAVETYHANPRQVFLLGFSQGAIISASVALTRPELVAGAVLLSGRILPEIKPLLAAPEQLAGKPFLVVQGTRDPVMPPVNGRASRDFLTELGANVTYREYPMGHEISRESLEDTVNWLGRQLDS
jgi:phospholipase/carboxylesterase